MKSFLLALVFSFSAYSTQYIDPIRNIRFDYDDLTWEIKETPVKQQGEEVDKDMAQKTIVTLQKKMADERYHSRFSIVVDDASQIKKKPDETLFDAYQKHAIDFMKSQRFDVISVKPVKLPKIAEPAFEIRANQRDFGLLFKQIVFLRGDKAYLLTAAARTAKFDAYAKELDKIFDSVEISVPKTSR